MAYRLEPDRRWDACGNASVDLWGVEMTERQADGSDRGEQTSLAADSAVSMLARNLIVYTVGVGFATAGALGLADAIDLGFGFSAGLFVLGLVMVVFVHERLDGPL